MLDITVADAVAVVGSLLAVLAFWRGTRAGETAATTVRPSSVVAGAAGVFLSTDMLAQMLDALKDIAEAIRESTAHRDRQHVEKLTDTIEELMKRLDRKP